MTRIRGVGYSISVPRDWRTSNIEPRTTVFVGPGSAGADATFAVVAQQATLPAGPWLRAITAKQLELRAGFTILRDDAVSFDSGEAFARYATWHDEIRRITRFERLVAVVVAGTRWVMVAEQPDNPARKLVDQVFREMILSFRATASGAG
ncbi:MAG TPA: hypothetical protein VGC47_03515 [Acidimicrobiia bacterium]